MMVAPAFMFEIFASLGLGQQLMTAGTIGLLVLYLFRARKAGGLVVSAMSTAWLITVSVASVFVLVIVFNWADPNTSEFLADISLAVARAVDVVTGPVVDFIEDFLSGTIMG